MDQDLKDLEAREDMIVGSQYANDFANHLFNSAVAMNRQKAKEILEEPELIKKLRENGL